MSPPPRRGKLPVLGKLAIAAGILLTIGAVVPTMLPTSLSWLSADHPPFVERSGRVARAGCGLSEIAVAGGCRSAEPAGVREEEVSFESTPDGGWRLELHGTLSLPEGLDGKRPAAVLIHGSGPNDRDCPVGGDLVVRHAPFPVLKAVADLLARHGIVVLRYDKRACGRCYPGANWDSKAFRFRHLEADAKRALAFLRTRPEVDEKALVVVGHSEGGQLAPFVAAGEPGIAALVWLAGTTQTFERGLIGQYQRLEAARTRQLDLNALNVYLERQKYQACFDKLREAFVAEEECIGGGVTQQAMREQDEQATRTLATLRALDTPIFAVQGNLDINIDPGVARELADGLRDHDAEIHYLDGMSHSLVDSLHPSDPPSLAPALVAALSEFVHNVKRK